jgi:3-deoxy-7-phosphoheptulonate synthase
MKNVSPVPASETSSHEDEATVHHEALPSPQELKELYPVTEDARVTIKGSREVIRAIVKGQDPRMFVVVGPCSIHDTKAALEYAAKLSELQKEVKEKLFLVMRCYFEKPRSALGWKGFINDPFIDGSCSIGKGITMARALLREVACSGVPTATEALDPAVQPHMRDLISWTAIGARTVESQVHRELASGLLSPVGFKNATDGRVNVAIDAMIATGRPHTVLSVGQEG